MKILYPLLLSILLFSLLACSTTAQTPAEPAPKPTPAAPAPFVTWDKKSIELGTVKRGEKRAMFFEFTNTSGENIQIDIVDACDCTAVEFPRGVIAPGGKGRIDAEFNSAEKTAPETIEIRIVFHNTDPNGNPRMEVVQYKFEIGL